MGLAVVTKVKVSVHPPAAVLELPAAVHRPPTWVFSWMTSCTARHMQDLFPDTQNTLGFSIPRNMAHLLEATRAHVG